MGVYCCRKLENIEHAISTADLEDVFRNDLEFRERQIDLFVNHPKVKNIKFYLKNISIMIQSLWKNN